MIVAPSTDRDVVKVLCHVRISQKSGNVNNMSVITCQWRRNGGGEGVGGFGGW